MKRVPLPPDLAAGPFAASASGLAPKRLRAADLDRSIYGMRVQRTSEPLDLVTRCRALAMRLRDDAVFSHTTAALLYGAPLPLHLERDPTVHVTVPASEPAPHARGIHGHTLALQPGDVSVRAGLTVTSPARTWCDLASILDLGDLVAVGDFFVARDLPLVSIAELHDRVLAMKSGRGIRRVRQAVALVRDGSESRPETQLRVILVLAGLPEPVINHTLVDSETGKQVRPDFIFVDCRMILEYQGDYHRTKSQWRRDMTRRSRLEAEGWYVMELNADDLKNSDELVDRVLTVMARRTSNSPR